jgi:hypothetical protein
VTVDCADIYISEHGVLQYTGPSITFYGRYIPHKGFISPYVGCITMWVYAPCLGVYPKPDGGNMIDKYKKQIEPPPDKSIKPVFLQTHSVLRYWCSVLVSHGATWYGTLHNIIYTSNISYNLAL